MAIAFDASNGQVNLSPSGTSDTMSHTCTGSDLILFVAVVIRDNDLLTGITYNSVSMASVGKAVWATSVNAYVYLYYLAGPATGAHNVVATYASTPGTRTEMIATSYTGAAQTGIPNASAVQTDNSAPNPFTMSVVSTKDNAWTVMAMATNAGTSAGSGTTIRTNEAPDGSVLMADSNGVIHPAGSTSLNIAMAGGSVSGGIMAAFAVRTTDISIADSSAVSDTPHIQLVDFLSVSDSTAISDSAQVGPLSIFTVADIVTMGDSVSLSYFWPDLPKHSSTFANQSKSSSIWTDQSLNSAAFTNQAKS